MGQITRLSANQFENLTHNAEGVTLVYRSINRDGAIRESAVVFTGEEYIPKSSKQNEIFRVWKSVVTTFWNAKMIEASLKEDNGGIAVKLRSSTPASIIVRCADKKEAVRWDVEGSIWQRIGLIPTKRDMEECVREYKKKTFRAAKASFDALNFRAKFSDTDMPEMERADIKDDANESK